MSKKKLEEKKKEQYEATAGNERSGTMAAVIPQTILWEIARYYPAASLVEAATSPSRFDVRGNRKATVRSIWFFTKFDSLTTNYKNYDRLKKN